MSVELQLRAWQAQFTDALAAHPSDDFLLVACPAAGKTIAAAAAVARVMEARDCDQLIVVCPTVVVRDQWTSELNRLGYRMSTSFEGVGWPEHLHGVSTTYAQVAQRGFVLAEACRGRRTVVIFDEIHHAGELLAWGASIHGAFGDAVLRLALSGTPFRSDSTRIPFIHYDADGTCVPDFAYDYARAVRDGACRPIEFRAHDGVITWLEAGEPVTASFAESIDRAQHPRRLRASLDPDQPYLATLLADAHADVLRLREHVPDVAGLIVCDSQAHALEIDRLITEIAGSAPVLAMSDIPYAHHAIRDFAESADQWLVSVRMVAEGVDIPRLGVVAWATAARTELMVRQVVGRALRGRDDFAALPAVVHMPADPQLIRYAGRIEVLAGVARRRREAVAPPGVDGDRELGERAPRAIEAIPSAESARTIAPALPETRLHSAPEPVEVSTPELPDSPAELAAAERSREGARAELFALLSTYAQLRRIVTPGYQLATAHRELAAEVGPVGPGSDDERVVDALDWVRRQTSAFGAAHPQAVKELASMRRRLSHAAESAA